MKTPVRIKSATPLVGFRVNLAFTDASERIMDLEPYLEGPIFAPMRKDPAEFRRVRVDPDFGGLEWPNGADICPDVLYHGRTPASQEKASR